MAESNEDRSTEDLSEEASPYRLEENRQKGKVAQSRELTGMLGLLVVGAVIYWMAPRAGFSLYLLMRELFDVNVAASMKLSDTDILWGVVAKAVKAALWIIVPIGVAGILAGALSSFSQIGAIFSWEPLQPDFKKLNPIQGIKKFVGMKQFYDAIRLILRASAVAGVAYIMVKDEILRSPIFILSDPSILLTVVGDSSRSIFGVLLMVLLVFAGFDFWLQKWEYSKSVRLTKQEQKQEHKEREGDPLIKAKIRAIQRDVARKRMMDAVKTADVVITNPTHFAIAIKYDRLAMDAPQVIAKGKGHLAKRIKEIASSNNIPRVENKPLARALYATVKVGKVIPRALFQAVAEILAYVYRLKQG